MCHPSQGSKRGIVQAAHLQLVQLQAQRQDLRRSTVGLLPGALRRRLRAALSRQGGVAVGAGLLKRRQQLAGVFLPRGDSDSTTDVGIEGRHAFSRRTEQKRTEHTTSSTRQVGLISGFATNVVPDSGILGLLFNNLPVVLHCGWVHDW